MNPQETQQVTARDKKWVPFSERVKVSSTNVRLETTVPQKEETFQVAINLIKNSSCFKAFTIFVDFLEIFMQQFWYSIKKIQGIDSYEFLLANKKCVVYADVFRTILDICPRVEGVNFTDVPDDDIALTFLINLGYKGPLYKHVNIENFDYPELIWEDLAYQIDHRKEKRSRRENMPFPRFTKETVDVSEESEPESVKRKTFSKRRVKKKVTLCADDNIISDDPDTALELEFVPEHTKRRKSGKVTSDPPKKLKSVPSLTPKEQEATDIMQALKESKRQPGTVGSSEGTGTKPGVPDESTVVSVTSSEGTGTKPCVSPSMLTVPVSLIFEPSVLTPVQEYPLKAIITALPPLSVFTTPSVPQQTTTLIPTPTITTDALIITTVISESNALSAVQLRVAKLEKDMSDLKKIDLFTEALAALKTQVLSVVDNYLGSKVRDTIHANKSFNRNPANHRLYHALKEALIEDENAIDKGVADTVQNHKRKHDDDEDDNDED
ncbi:hypothetical protein Tco_1091791 [Tanacetum coccineum]|uniref:Uncharacterized protein n=1 Tax=Tanacetum coccineum TaxID=301880 RepID=A0ABQ5I827_9ASTR